MNDHFNNDDPLDALLASRPLEPSADFAEQVMARLRDEDALEVGLDAHLAASPVSASPDYTDRVMSAIEAESGDKILGFPSWMVALGGMAALLVAGMLAFVALFEKGNHDARAHAIASTVEPAPVAVAVVEVPENPDATFDTPDALPEESVEPSAVLAGMSEWEELLVMQETLSDIAALNEVSDWQTVAMLAN